VEAITPPKEVQEMLNRATGVAAQDADKYRAITAADAMRDMARNPGGGGDAAGMGLGLGAGLVMAQQMGQSFAQPSQAQVPQPAATAPPRPGASTDDIRTKLKDLKSLKDDGLISDADFEEQKRRLLALL
jgi:membrane protease subunit (stomatin/prohibitin family)